MLTTVAAYGLNGGSARVRVYDWLAHLGIDAHVEQYLGTASVGISELIGHPWAVVGAEWRLRRLGSLLGNGTTLLSRRASPLSGGMLEAGLLKSAEHGVYDFDDALMLDTRQGLVGRAFPLARVWRASVESADVVIAGNEYLADAASEVSDSVVVIPSCVEPGQYTVKDSYEYGLNPVAVWLGSPSTERYLVPLTGTLLRENARSGLRLMLISRGSASLGELDRIIDRVDWSLRSFAGDLARGDFGIMPMPDTPWSRGKCAYKLLQYGAAGLPLVGSPVGANRAALEVTGGWAPTGLDEWSQAVQEVVDMSKADRARHGLAALQGVIDHYSFARWEDPWRSALQI